MGIMNAVLDRMFGRPRGLLGQLGARIMKRSNADMARWVITLMDVQPTDRILEVGFGSGAAIHLAAEKAHDGFVAGVDISEMMVRYAGRQHRDLIKTGRVELRLGVAEHLPYADDSFDRVVAMNNVHIWPDAVEGMQEAKRVLKPGGVIALSLTRYPGAPEMNLVALLTQASFVNAHLEENELGVCALASK